MSVFTRVRDGLWEAPGAAGVWPALYTGAAATVWAHAAGLSLEPRRWLAIVIGAMGAFLLDRVKVSDRAIDPADAAADGVRFAWLGPWRGRWRLAAWACVVVATIGLAPMGVSAAAPALLALLTIAYAGLPRGGGAKRLPGLKPVVVGLGLALYVALGSFESVVRWSDALWAFMLVVLVVAADAALCDLDEAGRDGVDEPGAWASRIGRWGVVGAAVALHAVASAMAPGRALTIGLAALALSSPMLMALGGRARIKDLVDLRLPVMAVWMVWAWSGR